jgi:hypothetical protein
MDQPKFDQWCIVEIMGHQKYAGRVTEQPIAGSAMLRIDIPAGKTQPAFSKLFNVSSVYALTPTTEELATAVAASLSHAPIGVYDLPESMQAKLRAPSQPRLPAFDDDDLAEQISEISGDDDDGPF